MSLDSGKTSPGVVLRALEPEDLDFLYEIENDRSGWCVGNANVPYSRYVLHDYVANATNDIYADGQVRMVVENGRGETVGMVDIVNFSPRHLRAEVSVIIHKRHRNKGYASSAIRQIIPYASSILHLHQLYAVISLSNSPSIRLFEKNGFVEACRLPEWLYDGRNFSDAALMQLRLI